MAPTSLVLAISSAVIGVHVTVVISACASALISKCVHGDEVIDPDTANEDLNDSSCEKWLVEKGFSLADLRQPNKSTSWTAMSVACSLGELTICRYLAAHGAKDDIFKKNPQGRLPIENACANGHVNTAQWLLANGAGDAIATKTILPAISYACLSGHTRIMQWVADNGGAEQIWGRSADYSGQSLLMIACGEGHLPLSQWLLEFGLDINAQDKKQRTPLICACSSGNLALVRLLYDAGAKNDRQSKKGFRHQKEMMMQSSRSRNLALVKWLNNRGTFNDKDRAHGVLFACQSAKLDIAKWLYDQGVSNFSILASSHFVDRGSKVAWEIGSPIRKLLSALHAILSADDYRNMMQTTAALASSKGLLHITQFAIGELPHEEFEFDPLGDDPLGDPWYGAVACGHTHILEWFLDTLPVVETKLCLLGQVACRYGKTASLKMCVAACSVEKLNLWRKFFYETACERGHVEVLQWLLQELPCPQDGHLWALDLDVSMIAACKKGHLLAMKCLVYEGAVDLDRDQISKLFVVSCRNGHLGIAKWLHEEFSLTHEDFLQTNKGGNVVNIACSRGDHPMVAWMFSIGGIHFFQTTEEGEWAQGYRTPILNLCLNGHFTLAKWLLRSCSAAPDILNWKHIRLFQRRLQSDLSFAKQMVALFSIHGLDLLDDDNWNLDVLVSGSLSQGKFEIFEWLQTLGKVNPRFKDSKGRTIFFLACQKSNLDTVKWLFENGAAEDIRNPCSLTQDTPMSAACELVDLSTMKWLFENGAREDLHKANTDGKTPLLISCSRAYRSEALDIMKWLFENGAKDDIRKKDNKGRTPMALACLSAFGSEHQEHLETMNWLFENGAKEDIRITDNAGNTPMALACSRGHLDIARWLFKVGAQADIHTPNDRGDCPMVTACTMNHLHVVEWLYECGASDDVRMFSKEISLIRWYINQQSEMAPWLFIHGVTNNSSGDFDKSLLSGSQNKHYRETVCDLMLSVLTDHFNVMSLILPAINRDISILPSSHELPVCHLRLLQGHEKTLVQKIMDFAGIPRGRCLKNARDVARSLTADQMDACNIRSKAASAERRRAEEALALALSADTHADMKLSQARKDYAFARR